MVISTNTKPHAILLASPGAGHLVPMAELANQLTMNHGFHVTIFVVTMEPSSSTNQFSNKNQSLYELIMLPHIDSSAQMSPNDKIMTRLVIIMRAYIPVLRDRIQSMSQNPALLVVDLFGTEFLSLADEFNVVKYVYIPSSAWFLAETLYVPLLDKNVKHDGPLHIPGCKRVEYDDILNPVFDPDNRGYDEYVRIGLELRDADGLLLNTWEDLEPKTLFALRNNETFKKIFNKPVYPVGPLVSPVRPECLRGELLEWLNEQPRDSVLYVSFGSGGTLSSQQTMELAYGLEKSQLRFVWVMRPPIEHDRAGVLFQSVQGSDPVTRFLPDGFLIRTQKLGRVVLMWAPQSEILAHPSTGGFLSHCGWNSILESLVNGVPIIAWPLYAEQNMNATMLEEEIGVAIRPKVLPTKGIVGRAEIEKMVRMIMVGDDGVKIRHRVKEVQECGKRALTMMGSSFKSLAQMANLHEMRLIGQMTKASNLNA